MASGEGREGKCHFRKEDEKFHPQRKQGSDPPDPRLEIILLFHAWSFRVRKVGMKIPIQ